MTTVILALSFGTLVISMRPSDTRRADRNYLRQSSSQHGIRWRDSGSNSRSSRRDADLRRSNAQPPENNRHREIDIRIVTVDRQPNDGRRDERCRTERGHQHEQDRQQNGLRHEGLRHLSHSRRTRSSVNCPPVPAVAGASMMASNCRTARTVGTQTARLTHDDCEDINSEPDPDDIEMEDASRNPPASSTRPSHLMDALDQYATKIRDNVLRRGYLETLEAWRASPEYLGLPTDQVRGASLRFARWCQDLAVVFERHGAARSREVVGLMSPDLFTDVFQDSVSLQAKIAGFLAALPTLVTFEMFLIPYVRGVAKFVRYAFTILANKFFKDVVVKSSRPTHLTNLIFYSSR